MECRRFFSQPKHPRQRQYEALRAYFVDERPSAEVARAFGYSAGSFRVLCHHFRREAQPEFFLSPRAGPRTQPKKSAARELIVATAQAATTRSTRSAERSRSASWR